MAKDDSHSGGSTPPKWSPLAPPSQSTSIGWKSKKKQHKKSKKTEKKDPPAVVETAGRKRPRPASASLKSAKNERITKKDQQPALDSKAQKSVNEVPQEPPENTQNQFVPKEGITVEWKQPETAILSFQEKEQNNICLVGRATVKVLEGEVDILGFRLDPSHSSVPVDSPWWTSALTFHCSAAVTTKIQLSSVRPVNQTATFQILDPTQTNVRPTVIPSSWKTPLDTIVQKWQQPTPRSSTLEKDPTTSSRHDEARRTTARLVVCGAKNTGKSTCIRYALHRLLSSSSSMAQVAVLDCDAGQPELSPPGMVTLTLCQHPLLSPPHLHMASSHERAYFYGSTTSKTDASLYLQCITQLVQAYEKKVQDDFGGDERQLPLLVNTDGWVKGMGFEILSAVLSVLGPCDVLQLQGEMRSKVFELPTSVLEHKVLHVAHAHDHPRAAAATIPSRTNSISSLASDNNVTTTTVVGSSSIPSQLYRSLRLCTYFLGRPSVWDGIELGQQGIADTECQIARLLAAQAPYAVPTDCVKYNLMRGDVDVRRDLGGTEDMVLNALNGSIVGLCQSNAVTQDPNSTAVSDEDSECMPCVGLGLIRSIDRARRIFYILTPVSPDHLQSVNVLIRGNIQVPLECLYRGVHSESFPFLSCDGLSVGIGADVMKSRNTLSRRGSQQSLK